MKKNVMMRVASVLLVAVLLTTCAISGTFAKYVTTASSNDSARVAKWGVVIGATGSLFEDNYFNESEGNGPDFNGTGGEATISVDSSGDLGTGITNTVAPGTKNGTGMTISVTGTPEVDVKIDVSVTNDKDVFLAEGKYEDVTTATVDTDVFEVGTGGYYPITYKLTQNTGSGATVIAEGKLSAIVAKLESLDQLNVPANTPLETVIGTLNITWEWNYTDHVGVEVDDRADTVLGALMAGTTIKKDTNDNGVVDGVDTAIATPADYNLTTSISIAITVTQID